MLYLETEGSSTMGSFVGVQVVELRPVEAEVVVKTLRKIGFHPVRQRGSYLIMKHPDGRSTVIPVYLGEELWQGILMEIMSDVRMSKKEFLELLER